jgi:putative sigma-54 modulation protein
MQMEFVLKNTKTKGENVKEFLEDKTGKLERYVHGHFHARWVISYENDEHEAHLHITANNVDMIGKARHHIVLTAIEEAVEKVERQLNKHREMVQDHHKKEPRSALAAGAEKAAEDEE